MPDAVTPQSRMDLVALGVHVSVHFTGAESHRVAKAARAAWIDCRDHPAPAGAPHRRVEACLDPDPSVVMDAQARSAVADQNLDLLLERLTQVITRVAVEARAHDLTMLHACGLAHPVTGATVGLVAPSGTGKTTLALRLGTQLSYVSDETVGITDAGEVVPYLKPLSVIPDSGRRVKAQVPARDLELLAPPADLHLVALAKLVRDPSCPDAPQVQEVSTTRGVYEMGPEVSFIHHRPRPLHHLARLIDKVGGFTVIRYREAHQLIDVLPALLTREVA